MIDAAEKTLTLNTADWTLDQTTLSLSKRGNSSWAPLNSNRVPAVGKFVLEQHKGLAQLIHLWLHNKDHHPVSLFHLQPQFIKAAISLFM